MQPEVDAIVDHLHILILMQVFSLYLHTQDNNRITQCETMKRKLKELNPRNQKRVISSMSNRKLYYPSNHIDRCDNRTIEVDILTFLDKLRDANIK